MDIYNFINSKDIKNHLKNIKYKFNSLETSWLIYQCKELNIDEKSEYWKEVISKMADCKIPKRINCTYWDSLHNFLNKYINAIQEEKSYFYKNDKNKDFVYTFSYNNPKDNHWCNNDNIFLDVDECLKECHNISNNCKLDSYNIKFIIKKISVLNPKDVFEAIFENGDIIEIIDNPKILKHNDDVLFNVFDGLYFDFPTPFKKGDILWIPECHKHGKREPDYCKGPFILESLATEYASEDTKKYGDISDMSYNGLFADKDGTVYWEYSFNYMNLEYFSDQHLPNEKILPVLSKYLKNELDIEVLLHEFKHVQLEALLGS